MCLINSAYISFQTRWSVDFNHNQHIINAAINIFLQFIMDVITYRCRNKDVSVLSFKNMQHLPAFIFRIVCSVVHEVLHTLKFVPNSTMIPLKNIPYISHYI